MESGNIKTKINLYTYSDYITWPDTPRYELIDGIAYMMSSPSELHQSISVEICRQLANFLHGKQCKVYHAPFDVRLNAENKDDTVLQPDIFVLCDKNKIQNGKCVVGPPDFIIEIMSPSTAQTDRIRKFNLYLQAGVREYWIISPEEKYISTHVLLNGHYTASPYSNGETVPVSVLDGCSIDFNEVFTV